jgi:flagellar FliL protein
MAAAAAANADPSAGGETAVVAGKSSALAKVNVLLFLLVVIVAECLLAYFYLPSSAESATMAGVPAAPPVAAPPAAPAHGAETAEKGEHAASEQAEVDLGEFTVTAFQPASNSTIRIDFHLFGTVATENAKDFARLMEENKHRFREQVLVTVRGAELTDLTDAGLGLMKRRILDKTNRILGKPLLRSVIFSDFAFIEQ